MGHFIVTHHSNRVMNQVVNTNNESGFFRFDIDLDFIPTHAILKRWCNRAVTFPGTFMIRSIQCPQLNSDSKDKVAFTMPFLTLVFYTGEPNITFKCTEQHELLFKVDPIINATMVFEFEFQRREYTQCKI